MGLTAHACGNGHVTYPGHYRCPECHEPQTGTIDLTEHTGTVITWTNSTSTPPGVREPNPIAIVEFDLDTGTVRVIGGLTTTNVSIGQSVKPVFEETLRDPNAGIRLPETQNWSGYRFAPLPADG